MQRLNTLLMRCCNGRKYIKKIFRKSKSRVAIAICIAIILVIVLIFGIKGCNNSGGNYSIPKLPDMYFDSEDGYSAYSPNNNVQIPAVTGIIVRSDTLSQKLNISNPSSNKYVFIVDLYLSNGTKLYTSDYIYPSQTVTDVEFSQTLKSGVYRNALMVYTCCTPDDQHTPLTRYEFPIEIRSSIE